MKEEFEIVTRLIKERRSIFPPSYTGQEIPKEAIEAILESANYAPTHKLTEPWRFMVFRKAAKSRLAAELARLYKETTPPHNFLQKKYDSITLKFDQSDTVIVINAQLHPAKLPEWEEVAALGCAVQNMALTAEALGIGGYWSSPGTIDALTDFLGLQENEKCYGLYYMGYHKEEPKPANRRPISEKVKWLED
jgi:nitroreductase